MKYSTIEILYHFIGTDTGINTSTDISTVPLPSLRYPSLPIGQSRSCTPTQPVHVFSLPTIDVPVEIVKGLDQNIKALAFDTVMFTCQLSNPCTDVVWYKDGVEIISDRRMYVVNAEDEEWGLVIHKVSKEDEATYTVKVQGMTSIAKLDVHVGLLHVRVYVLL